MSEECAVMRLEPANNQLTTVPIQASALPNAVTDCGANPVDTLSVDGAHHKLSTGDANHACPCNAPPPQANRSTDSAGGLDKGCTIVGLDLPQFDKHGLSSSQASVGTSRALSCRKRTETGDFRVQLYILLGIGALFILWAALYFPLYNRY